MNKEEFDKDMARIRRTITKRSNEKLSYYSWVDNSSSEKSFEEALDDDLDKIMTDHPEPS